MGFRDSLVKGVSELQSDEEENNQTPRSSLKQTGSSSRAMLMGTEGYDLYKPPREDMQLYWRTFEEVPFIRRAINIFVSQVVKPGWWVEAGSQGQAETLAKWLRKAAVLEGETNKDLALLLEKILTQLLVRGTVLIEHVPDGENMDTLAGLKLVNPETVTVFTKDGSSILLDPDDDTPTDVPTTEGGDTPAYVQFYEPRFKQEMIAFSKNDMTKITRDADTGEQYGVSIIRTVIDRIESYRKKLDNLDQAIEHKAWPTWIFQFGPEDPWHPDDIDDFMAEETEDNYTPGTKHGVQGDIEVETVGGEVPDIQEELQHDIDHILTPLPTPKWAVGRPEDVNQFVSQQQENLLRSEVQQARRKLEYSIQGIVEVKAEQLGMNPEDIQIHISPPEGEEDPYKDRGTRIHYTSDANNNQNQNQAGNQEAPGSEDEQANQNEEQE